MSNQPLHPFRRQLFVFIVALLFCGGGLQTASGQDWVGKIEFARSPNPRTNLSHPTGKPTDARAKRTTANNSAPLPAETRPDEKQQAIELAIEQGNQSRDMQDYAHALAHYQKAQTLSSQDARAFYGMGNLYADLSCYESAIADYLKALKIKKDYVEALIGLGYAYFNKERYDEAEKQFQAAHDLKPNNIDASLALGRVKAKKGKFQEAVTQINLVINAPSIENKDRATACHALGLVYEDQNKWQDAIVQYERAISFNPDLAIAYFKLGLAQTVVAFSKFGSLTLDEVRTPDTMSLSASAREAGENIQRAIERGFKHPAAYFALGNALMYQSNYPGAANKFNKFLEEVGKLESQLSSITADFASKCDSGFSGLNAIGYWSLGFLSVRESSLETNPQRKAELLNEAIKHMEQAIKVKPDYATAYSQLGAIYSMQGRHKEAIEQYQKALNYETKENSKASDYAGIGLAYYLMGLDNEAIYNLNKAIEHDPNNPSPYLGLSIIYEKRGNFDEAIAQQKKAMERESQVTAHSYYFLASAYYRKARSKGNEDDFVEAIRLSKKALEINDAYASAYFLLGQIYKFYKAGAMADEAIANYEKAAQYDPQNVAVNFHLADLYFTRKQNNEAAIKYLREAIRIKPDYAEAYDYLGAIYHQKKDDTEAVKQLLEAIKYNAKYLRAYLDLAGIYKAQKNYPEAIKYLEEAIRIAPTNFQPYKELAKVYEEQQKNDDAVDYYKKALSCLKADDETTKNLYLGRIARLQGRYAEAIGYFQKVSFPDEPGQTNYEIGVVYVVSKNKSAALVQHQELVRLKSPLAEELLKKIKEMK